MKGVGVVVLLGLSAGGCATYYWSKPGVTQQQFEYDKASCTAEAQARLPPAMQAYPIGGGYTSPMYTTCTGGYYTANCMTTGGGYTPPTVVPIDMNADARNSAFDACMYGRGYNKVSPSAGGTAAGQDSAYTLDQTTPDFRRCMDTCKAAAKNGGGCWHKCSGTTDKHAR